VVADCRALLDALAKRVQGRMWGDAHWDSQLKEAVELAAAGSISICTLGVGSASVHERVSLLRSREPATSRALLDALAKRVQGRMWGDAHWDSQLKEAVEAAAATSVLSIR
jgi:methionine salvage enolase-phosphatase E1